MAPNETRMTTLDSIGLFQQCAANPNNF